MEKIISVCKRTFRLFREKEADVYAGYATLFTITAIFPMLMLIISLVNMIPGYSPDGLTDLLFDFLPDLSSVKGLVNTMISNLKEQSTGLLASVSAVTTLWSASVGISALQRGLKKLEVYIPAKLPDKLTALIFTLLFIIFVPAMLLFQVLGSAITSFAYTIAWFFRVHDIAETVASVIQISGVITVAMFLPLIFAVYAFLPGGKRKLSAQIPGTVFTALLWYLFTKLFSFFIPRFYNASGLYGSLASLFLMLLWLRFIVTILFMGAALNRTLEEEKQPQKGEALKNSILKGETVIRKKT